MNPKSKHSDLLILAIMTDRAPIIDRSRTIALVVLMFCASLMLLHDVNRIMPQSHNDLLPRWVGAKLALQGEDPYSAITLREIQTAYYGRPLTPKDKGVRPQAFAYPAYFIFFLAPLTHLPWSNVWLGFLFVVAPMLAFALWISTKFLNSELTRFQRMIAILLAFSSWPLIWGLRLEQPTLPVIALLLLGCAALRTGFSVFAGLLFVPTIIKPQLVLPLLAWLIAWAIYKRLWLFFLSFTAFSAFLLVWTEATIPGWFSHWLIEARAYGTLAGLMLPLQNCLGYWPGLIATVLLTLWSILLLWQWRRVSSDSQEFGTAIAIIFALTVCLTLTDAPMIYNQVFLFPAVLVLVRSGSSSYYVGLVGKIAVSLLIYSFLSVLIAAILVLAFHAEIWESLAFRNDLLGPILLFAMLVRTQGSLVPRWPIIGKSFESS